MEGSGMKRPYGEVRRLTPASAATPDAWDTPPMHTACETWLSRRSHTDEDIRWQYASLTPPRATCEASRL
jgi:hypothetical protein